MPYPSLFYTSNSPVKEGSTVCDMRRFLGQHAGPHGTGWRLKSQAIPLATGAAFHRGQQLVAEWILEWQVKHPNQRLLPGMFPIEVAAWAAIEAAGFYKERATARGLALAANDATAAEAVTLLIAEQAALIEAMVLVWCVVRLPALLAEYQLAVVEREDGIVFDCTCGLGETITDDVAHLARGCRGIAYGSKCDQLWRHAQRGTYTYLEFKGWGTINAGKERKWEHDNQIQLNMEAASRKFGVPVDECLVDILLKGWRGRDRNDPPEAPKYQHTPLIYGYWRGGQPPFSADEWYARSKWTDEAGKEHRLPFTGKVAFRKLPVWEPQIPLVAPQGNRPGASRVETWVTKFLQPEQYPEVLRVLGPFPRDLSRMPRIISGMLAEERRWQSDVALLREREAVMPDAPLVEAIIPRTWECTEYDGTPCAMKRICFREPGWENPEGMGVYERRRPHHLPEAAAVEALGVELPVGEWDEDQDEGGDQ